MNDSPANNPLVAAKQDSTTWHTGINLIDDATATYEGISSGSWVEGGVGAFGTGLDALSMAMNPVGTLISYGLNWLIEHVRPLKQTLDQLAGDPDQIAAYARTWKNVGDAVKKAAQDLNTTVTNDTANWTGQAADAYRANVTDKVNHITSAGTCANAIGTAVEMVGVLTGAVRMLVRDIVTQAIGDIVQYALEEVFSLGIATPLVAAQVSAQVANWMERITGIIKKLINSIEKLRPLMSKLEEIFAAVKKAMSEIHGRLRGEGGEGTRLSSADEPHTTTPHDSPHDGTTPGSHDDLTGEGTPGAGDRSTSPNGERPGTRPEEDGTNGGQRCEGNRGCDGMGGDPVDTVSGQMITNGTDVELPGVLPLILGRAYASAYPGGRLYGPGWSSTVDQRLAVDDAGVRYFGDDAQVLHYQHPVGQGAQTVPAAGARWPLTWDQDSDTYRIEDPSTGLTRHFGPATTGIRPITALTDRNGNRIGYHHDSSGRPVEIVHSGGYRVQVDTVDTENGVRVAALRLHPDIPLVEYRYDERGRLTEIVNSTGLPYRYEYDDVDRVTAWVDRDNYRYTYIYGDDGRVVRGEGQQGYLTADFTYDLTNRTTKVTNSLGHITVYHYDEHNHLTKVVDALGNTEITEYDRYHRLLSRTDPLGNTTRYTLGMDGAPVRVDRPDGTVVSVAYNSMQLPTEVTGPDGARWQYVYDERGNMLVQTDPVGAVTSYQYGEHGEVQSLVDALGGITTVTCDAAGVPLSVTDPSGATETYTLDALGRTVSVTDPLGAVTVTERNPTGLPARRVHPDGTVEMWHWNGNGDMLALTDRGGFTTRFEVGPFHLVAGRTDPDGTRHVFAHDTELRLTQVTNPQGLAWRYSYDQAGNLVAERDFNGRTMSYGHDAGRWLNQMTNAAGETVSITRDPLGRITDQRTSDGQVTAFRYDLAGQLVHATSPDSEVVLTRDPFGRVLTETVNGRTLTNAYDLLGRRVSRTTPGGHASTWEYDRVGRPSALTTGGRRITFGHDAAGRETHRWLGPATALTSSWDSSGRLTARQLVGVEGQESRVRSGRSWTYRGDGVPDSVTDAEGPRRFELDALGRVTAVRAANWSEQYAYDPSGNLSFAADSRGEAAPIASTGTLVRSAGHTHYDYDTQGRLVRTVRQTLSGQRQVWQYQYDVRNRLTGVVTPAGQRWRYRYDALGRRFAKQLLGQDGVPVDETGFTWDGEVLVEQAHTVASATTVTTWDYEPGTWSPVSQDRRSYYATAPQQVVDRQFHAIVTDQAGTPTELVTPDGRVDWRRRASVWGRVQQASQGVECLLRFPGQYHDHETGLDYNQHRYYDPDTGRYISPDPLGLDAAPNPYQYVPNPQVMLDPLGLIGKDRYLHLDRPGWRNYTLADANGVVYYSGMFGPGSTAASTQARHMANGNRFNPANGDTMTVTPGTRTYGESRLMEQRVAEQHGTIIGRDGDNYRGNRENPLANEKLNEYQDYEQRKRSGLGCPK
ncbi:RHS repeat-associated core domain-containing protein [Actinocrispum wychmicini]|uniref:RHS repeat-associated protein n=1 Tax=Actinocrispum wychmicini TaxID=1213861 RepID=A0A4R2JJT2_9PSEU|nr:RHS repeat-associated core domain-containing protein [Actinocrispum wychmicini]TCO57278.1 RHS repeat-associated protein [Actinocrispum wychmicini]